mmetsp:Transcript_22884/g.33783  ORF Transcript_22884/g.33783 Transcript_22884/m.33783 type:complete len:444 (+) Transcript_22884:53-1384(+)
MTSGISITSATLSSLLILISVSDAAPNGLRSLSITRSSKDKAVIPFANICPQDYPPSHPMLHDKRAGVVHDYEQYMRGKASYNSIDTPSLVQQSHVKYAVWSTPTPSESRSSVWSYTDGDDYVTSETGGWFAPTAEQQELTVTQELDGEWAAFSSWFLDSYSHFVHDHLPTIAYLKSVVSESTKFLLVDTKVARQVLEALDPDFYHNRIQWINSDEVFDVKGNLTVAVRPSFKTSNGCCGAFDPMRQWIAETHPADEDGDEMSPRSIVYDNSHLSPFSIEHTNEITDHIFRVMKRHNLTEELVIYDRRTQNDMTHVMSTFRRARTIIGPRGNGDNFAWTNPYPSNCGERTQMLEFIPGKDAGVNFYPYASQFNTIRKWPLDYHTILFSAAVSDVPSLRINLQDLDDALDYLWGGGDPALNSPPLPEESIDSEDFISEDFPRIA